MSFILTVSDPSTPNHEIVIAENTNERVLVGLSAKYVISDMMDAADTNYRVYDEDDTHVASINLHTLTKVARTWGIELDRAVAAVIDHNY